MNALKTAVLSLTFLSVGALAQESAFIAGAKLSTSISGEAEVEFDELNMTINEDIDSDSFLIFAGYQTERNNRFKVSFESRSFDFDESNDTEDATGLRFDWDFVYGEQQFHPFWSIGFGFYSLDDPIVLEGSNLEGDDLSGFSFQLGAGVKVDLTPQLELSLAFEHQAIAWEEIKEEYYDITANMTYAHSSLGAGLLYRF